MKKQIKKIAYSILAFTSFPLFASAHVKWFVDEDETLKPEHLNDELLTYLIIWGVIALVIILCGILLEAYLPKMKQSTLYMLNSHKHKAASLFSLIVGAYLLIASFSGFLFSPDIQNINDLDYFMIFMQAVIGMSLLVGASVRTGSIALISLWLLVFVYAGVLEALENIWVLGVGAFTLIYGREYFKLSKRKVFLNKHFSQYEEYALPILRSIVGFDLLFLGLSEKILRPELGLKFLETHHWNFMQNLGVTWFSDYLFVISAGMVESLFGIVFMLGIVTRLNAVVLGIFFSIPPFLMGPEELIGHLPHLAVIILFIIFGSGDKLKIIKRKHSHHDPDRID